MVRIETQRLIIRDYCGEDIEGFHELFTNDEVMWLMPEIKTSSLDESRKFLYEAIVESKYDDRRKFFFAITLKGTDQFIGEIGFSTLIDCDEGRLVNLGYFIQPECWGKGLVTEAVRAIMAYAFQSLDVIKIESGCLKANVGSIRVMEKVGMIQEAEYVKHMYYNGELHDRLDFRMLKEEWEELQAQGK